MIIGFLGKGGSGKSSVSTQMALLKSNQGKAILAIDADHNMDFSYNLSQGNIPALKYFSQSLSSLQEAVGLSGDQKYDQAFLRQVDKRFTLSPLSDEIASYSALLHSGIRVMIAGPQTDSILYGARCSHSLTTPLKILLPLLELNENEMVIVDEKAGADGVSTGIVTGIDVGVIVCEPTLHSVKTAKQIATLMDFYGTPYVFVGNKVSGTEDVAYIQKELNNSLIASFEIVGSIKRDPSGLVEEWQPALEEIFRRATASKQDNRLERTVQKFRRNQEFTTS